MLLSGRATLLRALGMPFLAAILVAPAGAGRAATTSAPAQASILTPLSIVKTADLSFGRIVPGAAAGTVNIDAASGARTSSGPLTLVGAGDYGAATFVGLADRFRFVFVTNSAPPVLSRAGGGASMSLVSLQRTGTFFFVPAGGFIEVDVGGTLAVGANQPPGLYTGTFSVTMNYF
jgi:hypothetical protein